MVQSSNMKDTAGILLPMVEKQKMELLDGRFLEQPQKQQGNLPVNTARITSLANRATALRVSLARSWQMLSGKGPW